MKFDFHGQPAELKHGSVVIAAITSCTNTSNPSVMLGAALVAKKACELGLEVCYFQFSYLIFYWGFLWSKLVANTHKISIITYDIASSYFFLCSCPKWCQYCSFCPRLCIWNRNHFLCYFHAIDWWFASKCRLSHGSKRVLPLALVLLPSIYLEGTILDSAIFIEALGKVIKDAVIYINLSFPELN